MRLTRLDALRGIAATIVVLFHYPTFFYAPGEAVDDYSRLPLVTVLRPLYTHGNYAVAFFWLLSGIVFFHTYAARSVGFGAFFWRRFARLYPLHFATLLTMLGFNLLSVALFSQPVGPNNDGWHFVLQLFMATNWIGDPGQSFNYPIWSVSMEVLAYAAFFLFLRFTSRGWLVHLAILFTALGAALLFASYQATAVALFFIGCALERVARAIPSWLAATGVAAALAFVVAVAVSPVSRHVGLATEYALFPAILLCVLKVDLARPPLRHEVMGNLSYGIYLCHVPAITMLRLVVAGVGWHPASSPWFLLLTLTLVFAIAALSFRFLERPAQDAILRWRRLCSAGRPSPAADPYVEIYNKSAN